MNADTTDLNGGSDEIVAGEYALGVLSAADRDEAQRRINNDAAFAAIVDVWADRLQPLSDEIPEAPVPARAWSQLDSSLFGDAARPVGFWDSLALWRWLTVAASVAALASLAVLLLAPPPAAPLVASLHASDAGPTFLAKIDPSSGALLIRAAAGPKAERVPELWLIPPDGVPRSLGVIKRQGETAFTMPDALRVLAKPQTALAISLEPLGGSPTGQPTGPVIAIGKLQKI